MKTPVLMDPRLSPEDFHSCIIHLLPSALVDVPSFTAVPDKDSGASPSLASCTGWPQVHHSGLHGLDRKACAHQDPGAQLQAFKVEAVMCDMPLHVLEELQLCCSAALRPPHAAGNTDLCLLDAHKGAMQHSKHQLNGERSLEGVGQSELAEMGGGQHW